ncbi:dehydrogenase E1 component-domain-containing protein [Gamsiella multidivaricata]|uniref:dehydrogenase E1 component-domain-containing protein n=1 Tax=Gamsiella multidivaricata TaxID=101098 RepID=UPI002220F241|nr:dehydrogenase E1 component-domain-containing protein [Gamsiella multidivaricata]KAG0353587.1 alpha subunit of pyruvate dehydrogenase [Gamsiella multidivaricata]KAI7826566.1 dehydrogenase E1 component-domain-containing protein [Gamsiella multidivaricata]
MLSSPRHAFLRVSAAKHIAQLQPARHFASSAVARTITVNLPKDSFKTYNCEAPSLKVTVKKDDLLHMYKSMVIMRRMETTADGLYKSGLIRGFCHLCTGQEAVGVGLESALSPDDKVITAYRAHGFTYMMGGSIHSILAEVLGRKTGMSKGKGGSMHMFTPRFQGGNGIVGAQVPLGTGLAFAQKYLEKKGAVFTFYGDGAANQGQVFESFNMAKLWDLPCVFVCENNQYGMGTSAERSSASTEYYKRAEYIPGIKVDGMNVLAVHQAVAHAREWAVSGKGPLVLETETYRYSGHSMSDPGTTYRKREEIQQVRAEHDAITGLKQLLLEHKIVTEDDCKAIDKAARAEVDKATEQAKADPEPDLDSFWEHVYVKGTEVPFLRGREPEVIHRYK